MITVSAAKISLLCEQLVKARKQRAKILERDPNDVDWYLVRRADDTMEIIRAVIGLLYEGHCYSNNEEVWIHKGSDLITIYKEEEE